MGKTHHRNDRGGGGGGGGGGGAGGRHDPTTTNAATRATLISKSMSRLLRHAAVQEKIPIDAHGWVRVDHILGWRGLAKFQPKVELGEIVQCVKEDGKGRFGLWYTKETAQEVMAESEGTGEDMEAEASTQTETQTSIALRMFDTSQDLEPSNYKIRANQGHSIKDVSEEGLMTPITLPLSSSSETTPSTVEFPQTVVHGTFYSAYEAILAESLLKPMSRNHVHFSTGPEVETARDGGASATVNQEQGASSITGQQQPNKVKGNKASSKLAQMMSAAKVKSGMRPDAEILVYIDIKKALGAGMKWWRSENGVLLSEGLPIVGGGGESKLATAVEGDENETASNDTSTAATVAATAEINDKGGSRSKHASAPVQLKGISKDFWLEVIEVKEGLGTLWKDGSVVQELPDRLKGRALPMGKGRRGGGGGGGGGARGGDSGRGRGRGRGRGEQRGG